MSRLDDLKENYRKLESEIHDLKNNPQARMKSTKAKWKGEIAMKTTHLYLLNLEINKELSKEGEI